MCSPSWMNTCGLAHPCRSRLLPKLPHPCVFLQRWVGTGASCLDANTGRKDSPLGYAEPTLRTPRRVGQPQLLRRPEKRRASPLQNWRAGKGHQPPQVRKTRSSIDVIDSGGITFNAESVPLRSAVFLLDRSPQFVPDCALAPARVQCTEPPLRQRSPRTNPRLDLSNNHDLFTVATQFRSFRHRQPVGFLLRDGFQRRHHRDCRNEQFPGYGHHHFFHDPRPRKLQRHTTDARRQYQRCRLL
jgi:hypothetical protein